MPLQRADWRARQTAIIVTASRSFLKSRGGTSEVLRKSVLRFRPRRSGNDGGVRGGPGGRSESASAPPGPLGSYDRPGSLVSAGSTDQVNADAEMAACPRCGPSSGSLRSPTVSSGQPLGPLTCYLARWRAGQQCFPSSRWAALGRDLVVNGRNASDNSGPPRPISYPARQLSDRARQAPGAPTDSLSHGESHP